MSEKEYKEKSENLFKRNAVLISENDSLKAENLRLKNTIISMAKTIREKKEMWEYFEKRFVKVSTCNEDMKAECSMFQSGYCEDERCMEWLDLVDLLEKATENGEIK